MERKIMKSHCLPISIAISVFFFAATTTKAANFTCNSAARCQSLAGYIPTTPMTLGGIQSLFQLGSLIPLLSVNNLPLSTPPSYPLPVNSLILVPFPCTCSNGTGVSDHTPIYTFKSADVGLDNISRTTFDGFVTYEEIGRVNKIKDVNVIQPGQKLWIPLPCSCDEVGGRRVVHLGHVVAGGSTVEEIGKQFEVDASVLMKLNGISDPRLLQAGQILDVPLKACSSSIGSTSLDHDLLLPNNSYALTAENCIQCSCSSSSNYQLSCRPVQGLNKTECPASKCGGLFIGNSTGSGCDAATCAYQGYTNSTGLSIMSNLIRVKSPVCNDGDAPAPQSAGGSPGGGSPPSGSSVGRLTMNGYEIQVLFLVQIVLFWFSFLA